MRRKVSTHMQDQAPVTPDYDLGHYLRPLQRHRRLLVSFVLIGFALGLAYTVLSGSTYSSTTSLQVQAPPVLPGQAANAAPTGGRTTGPIDPDTEAQIAKSSTVLTLALKNLHSATSVGALRGRIDVTVPPNSTGLNIACTARSPKAAQACATAVANAYLSNRSTNEKAAVARQVAATEQRIKQLDGLIKKDTATLLAAQPGTQARGAAYNVQQTDVNARTQANNQLTQLLVADTTPGQISSPAGLGVSSKTHKGIPPIAGLVLGLILAVAAIFGRERFDRYVRHSDDLKHSGVALIAEIKAPRRGGRRQRGEAGVRTRFDQRVASVVAGAFDEQGGVIYVAPVSPEQRPDDVADRLGATLASVGHHVEIVRPSTVEVVESVPAPAVPAPAVVEAIEAIEAAPAAADEPSSALLGWPMPPGETPPRTEPNHIAVRPAVAVVQPTVEPAESVPMSIRMRLEMARRHAQFVIIDGDPAVTDAQAYVLAGLSDATLLTVDPEATTKIDLDEVVDQISVAGSELLGAVIWRPARRVGRGAGADLEAPTRHSGHRISSLRKSGADERAAANGSVRPTAPGTHPPRLDAAH